MKMKTITTEIHVNGILASRSCSATVAEPCRDHTAHFGFAPGEGPEDITDEVYEALQDAWDDMGGDREVTVHLHGDEIALRADLSPWDCDQCGERAVVDYVKCPNTGKRWIRAIVYCSTCSSGACRTHGVSEGNDR